MYCIKCHVTINGEKQFFTMTSLVSMPDNSIRVYDRLDDAKQFAKFANKRVKECGIENTRYLVSNWNDSQ